MIFILIIHVLFIISRLRIRFTITHFIKAFLNGVIKLKFIFWLQVIIWLARLLRSRKRHFTFILFTSHYLNLLLRFVVSWSWWNGTAHWCALTQRTVKGRNFLMVLRCQVWPCGLQSLCKWHVIRIIIEITIICLIQ